MRILIIQPWIRQGGAELISVHLANELQKRGHDVAIACTFIALSGMPKHVHELNYSLPPHWLSRLCERSRFFFLLLSPWILLLLVWNHSRNVEILNPHNFPASWIAVLVGSLRRIPVVWTCNEPPIRVPLADAFKVGIGDFLGWILASSWIDKFIARKVSWTYVPSERTRRQVRDRYKKDASVIPIGVDASSFSNGNDAGVDEKLIMRDKFVLLTVGKLHPQKNQVVCLMALRKVLISEPDTILVLAGDGPMSRFWGQLAREWGVADQVRFLGHVSSSEVQALYRACDLNLFPAINQSWGFTPFEALGAGRISVVSDDCGAAEVLAKEGIGVVCEPSADAFAESILKVRKNPARYEEMAVRGRHFVAQRLSWRSYTDRFVELINERDPEHAHDD